MHQACLSCVAVGSLKNMAYESMKQTAARSVETKSGTGLTPPPLPSEWREVPDPAGSGDVYYWNIETDAVMWEHPATVAGKALV